MSLFQTKKQDDKKGVLVFLIEDNQMYAQTLQHYLQKNLPEGSEVKIFPVGETAIMSLSQNPNFIVMDYHLDTKWKDASNGVEMAREIRQTDHHAHIIILSSQQDMHVVIDAVKIEKCMYMEKTDRAHEHVLDHIKKTLHLA